MAEPAHAHVPDHDDLAYAPDRTASPARTAVPGTGQGGAKLDADRAITLALREPLHAVGTALQDATPMKTSMLVAAGARLAAALEETAALARLEPVRWAPHALEISTAAVATQRIAAALRVEKMATTAERVETALVALGRVVEPSVWAASLAANKVAAVPMSEQDRVELAQQALAAVARQAAIADTSASGAREQVLAHCGPIPLHLDSAIDAIHPLVRDVRLRKTLNPDALHFAACDERARAVARDSAVRMAPDVRSDV